MALHPLGMPVPLGKVAPVESEFVLQGQNHHQPPLNYPCEIVLWGVMVEQKSTRGKEKYKLEAFEMTRKKPKRVAQSLLFMTCAICAFTSEFSQSLIYLYIYQCFYTCAFTSEFPLPQ